LTVRATAEAGEGLVVLSSERSLRIDTFDLLLSAKADCPVNFVVVFLFTVWGAAIAGETVRDTRPGVLALLDALADISLVTVRDVFTFGEDERVNRVDTGERLTTARFELFEALFNCDRVTVDTVRRTGREDRAGAGWLDCTGCVGVDDRAVDADWTVRRVGADLEGVERAGADCERDADACDLDCVLAEAED
jgi:hypothetical protein